ncbi:sugar-binding transcriptional regulator [Microbacterium esteraromaticum]|uniref:Sugar-binding transcriptional regulator n=1 Tax=Microbacterium esteraromaticum TaxID=57043 RepID=A0A939DW66_9MICO|nr:sugar-binding domain-containing protein [Microbacterium esteraromaticum]MBN8206411.1 sugar-binding transcriptional regulator [Microbacterium esteraromaticum]MBN8416566.1 sugar-binding transcriptional regulator [Microbacterium esteraromaticum]
MPVDDELLMVRVAELSYDENKTQDEIGALLGISRWKVGRLLVQAREQGIVRIEIVHPRARRLGVERALVARFGLKDAVVVPAVDNPDALLSHVAAAAAELIMALRPVPREIAVSWGRTLTAVADALPQGWATGVTVVQANGGVSLNRRSGGAASVAVTMAQRGAGQAVLLPSPAILERVETKLAIEADRTIAAILDRAARANTVLFTAGPCDAGSAHVENGYLAAQDIAELSRRGAVGDVLGRYIDADGNIVDPQLDARTVGIGLDSLRSAERAIFVTAGASKHDIARTVVSNGLCSVLVTDESTALELLEEM